MRNGETRNLGFSKLSELFVFGFSRRAQRFNDGLRIIVPPLGLIAGSTDFWGVGDKLSSWWVQGGRIKLERMEF